MLVRAWLASQAERGGTIGRVELRERAEWTIDGPFGVRSIGWEAGVSGGPDTDGWQRETLDENIAEVRAKFQRTLEDWPRG